MPELHHFEMPMSFTGRALIWGASSNILNPPNKNQGVFSSTVGKGCRAVARLVYQLAVIVLSPLGCMYHLFMAFTRKLEAWTWSDLKSKDRFSRLAWEHLKSAGHDALSPLPVILLIAHMFDTSERRRHLVGTRTEPAYLTEHSTFMMSPNTAFYSFVSKTLVKARKLLPAQKFMLNSLQRGIPVANPLEHTDNLSQMEKGLYRFDELWYWALRNREIRALSNTPSPDSTESILGCAVASHQGMYGRLSRGTF